jgi:hypothetical protein
MAKPMANPAAHARLDSGQGKKSGGTTAMGAEPTLKRAHHRLQKQACQARKQEQI